MKHKEKAEKSQAVNTSEEVFTDKNLGIEVEIKEESKETTESLDALKKQLDEKTLQCDENYNRLLRMQAEFDNFKKRTAKEREELFVSSLEKITKELLPVIDNMERAVASFRTNGLEASYVDGVEMIQKQLFAVMEKNGLKEIEAEGLEFDPNVHHAVMQVEGEADEENKVKEVLQKGYFLGNRVIRPSMVKVVINN